MHVDDFGDPASVQSARAYALASTESSMMWMAGSGTSISPSKSEAMELNAAIASVRLFLSR